MDVTAELCVDSLTQQEKFKVHNPVKHSGLDTATDLAENCLFYKCHLLYISGL